MALAHEIAVDKDFTLQKIQPANAVEKKARHGSNQSPSSFHLNTIVILQVKEIMQKAFWDLLEQQLEADPPQYTQVVKDFFSGVKDWFHFLWSGSHSPHRDQGYAL